MNNPQRQEGFDWRRFHRDQARRERLRYIREGRIIPAFYMKPQMLIKTDGKWIPEIILNTFVSVIC